MVVFVAVVKVIQVANVASHSNKYDTLRKNLLSRETSLIFGAFIVGLISFIIDVSMFIYSIVDRRIFFVFRQSSLFFTLN